VLRSWRRKKCTCPPVNASRAKNIKMSPVKYRSRRYGTGQEEAVPFLLRGYFTHLIIPCFIFESFRYLTFFEKEELNKCWRI